MNEFHREKYFSRIRRTKKFLRLLPRRTNLHRYPFLKWFATAARKRSYLWSFRVGRVIPALYAGCILTLLPVYGVQIPIAFALALLFRCNLMVLVALQFISNPLTIGPIYYIDYQVGDFLLRSFNLDFAHYDLSNTEWQTGIQWTKMRKVLRGFGAMMIGGGVIGYFFALVSSMIYRFAIKRNRLSHENPKK